MTAYEFADVYFSQVTIAADYFMNYVYILFAFLIAGYAIGPHLTRLLSGIVIALFTGLTLVIGASLNQAAQNVINLSQKIAGSGVDVKGALAWHSVIREAETGTIPVITTSILIVVGAAYLGSVLFFVKNRQRGAGQSPAA